jgi:ferredoxin
MKIVFDQGACQGHNRCYSLAPELFDVDDMGTAILKIEG